MFILKDTEPSPLQDSFGVRQKGDLLGPPPPVVPHPESIAAQAAYTCVSRREERAGPRKQLFFNDPVNTPTKRVPYPTQCKCSEQQRVDTTRCTHSNTSGYIDTCRPALCRNLSSGAECRTSCLLASSGVAGATLAASGLRRKSLFLTASGCQPHRPLPRSA